jgi:hypothetical protein
MNRATGDPCVSGGMWGHRGSRPRTQTPGRIVVSRGLLHRPPFLLPITLLAKAARPSGCSGLSSDPSFPVCLPSCLSVCLSVCSQLLLCQSVSLVASRWPC